MKKLFFKISQILILPILIQCTGNSYLKNRKNDAIDTITIGVEYPSYGMGFRIGPLTLGFLFTGGETELGKKDRGDGYGIRGGWIGKYESQQLIFGFLGGEKFNSSDIILDEKQNPNLDKHGIPELEGARNMIKSHNMRYLTFYDDPPSERKKRKKEKVKRHFIEEFKSSNPDSLVLQYIPPEDPKPYGYPTSFLFQIDLMFSIGGGMRLGFNIAEFFDFILGGIGVDILEDDI